MSVSNLPHSHPYCHICCLEYLGFYNYLWILVIQIPYWRITSVACRSWTSRSCSWQLQLQSLHGFSMNFMVSRTARRRYISAPLDLYHPRTESGCLDFAFFMVELLKILPCVHILLVKFLMFGWPKPCFLRAKTRPKTPPGQPEALSLPAKPRFAGNPLAGN